MVFGRSNGAVLGKEAQVELEWLLADHAHSGYPRTQWVTQHAEIRMAHDGRHAHREKVARLSSHCWPRPSCKHLGEVLEQGARDCPDRSA